MQLSRLLLLGGVAALLLWRTPWLMPLYARFLPSRTFFVWAGFVLGTAGLLLTGWARFHLGRFWSGRVALQEEHRLVRSGPIARLRHPIYTGILTALAGTTLLYGEWRFLIAFAILLAALWRKAISEENLLREEFEGEFRAYEEQGGFLLPRVFLIGRKRSAETFSRVSR